MDTEMRKQEELLYRGDYEIQVLQRKVARAGGERSDEEKTILNSQIETMSKALAGKTEEYNILEGQVMLSPPFFFKSLSSKAMLSSASLSSIRMNFR